MTLQESIYKIQKDLTDQTDTELKTATARGVKEIINPTMIQKLKKSDESRPSSIEICLNASLTDVSQ